MFYKIKTKILLSSISLEMCACGVLLTSALLSVFLLQLEKTKAFRFTPRNEVQNFWSPKFRILEENAFTGQC